MISKKNTYPAIASLYRYVEQLAPQEVADQLAFSVRHLRRKQQVALAALADWLKKQQNNRFWQAGGQILATFKPPVQFLKGFQANGPMTILPYLAGLD